MFYFSECFDLDVIFLLDGSVSVDGRNFTKVKNWTKNLTTKLLEHNHKIQIGIIQFSTLDKIKTEIKLKEVKSKFTFNVSTFSYKISLSNN